MKAVIEYTKPVFRTFFDLPVFDTNPKYTWSIDIFECNLEKRWILTFEETFSDKIKNIEDPITLSMLNTVSCLMPYLTEENIREINKGYFYCLDHPEIKKLEINL